MKDLLVQCVRDAGQLLLKHFGKVQQVVRKESACSVVTEVDHASEHLIAELIRRKFPSHSILGEETGYQRCGSDVTWVIDPIDGTSNFAAGLPWFGVMVAVLRHSRPFLAAMYLPVTDTLYLSERGQGVQCNGRPVRVTSEPDLSNVLCAYGMDASPDAAKTRREVELMAGLMSRARNVRCTNCLLDVCYTLDGRFGAFMNQACKIWDIAPGCLMFEEAGGILTDLRGAPVELALEEENWQRTYAVLGASPLLHRQVMEIIRQTGYWE